MAKGLRKTIAGNRRMTNDERRTMDDERRSSLTLKVGSSLLEQKIRKAQDACQRRLVDEEPRVRVCVLVHSKWIYTRVGSQNRVDRRYLGVDMHAVARWTGKKGNQE